MKCVFCGNELIKDKQTIERRIKGHLIYIKNVPVDLCESCGEVYIDDDIVTEMNKILTLIKCNELSDTTVIDYSAFKEQSATTLVETSIIQNFNNLVTT